MTQSYSIRIESNGTISIVNYFKGFAIFTIVVMHLIQNYIPSLPRYVHTMSSFGGTGVHLFFLCSGIGLYISQLRCKRTYIGFLRRRFLKIYVPYIVIVLISFFLSWMYHGSDRLCALFSHIFLFKMFVERYESSFGLQLWFISTIIQFYLIFIPLYQLKSKVKNHMFILLCLLLSVAWWLFIYLAKLDSIRIWNSFFLQYLWEFALGMVIGEYLYSGKTYYSAPPYIYIYIYVCIGVVFSGIQLAMVLFSEHLRPFNDIPALTGYTSFALFFCFFPIIRKALLFVSSFSYELYLVHILVFSSAFHFFNPQGIIVETMIGIASLVASCLIAYCYQLLLSEVKAIWKKSRS